MKTKTKRISALLVCIALIMSMVIIPVSAEESSTVTVTMTVSKYGELLKEATLVPVELTGKEVYTLDDVFAQAHILYYDGEDGYASEGISINKFWGHETQMIGYRVNGETPLLDYVVNNGDYVEAFLYKNKWPDTEAYTKFDKYKAEMRAKEVFELVLSQESYDADWNTVFYPCDGATVLIDGVTTDYATDENGLAEITFDEPGTYTVSAQMTKTVEGQLEPVPAITAPVCEVTVKEPASTEIIHNIANVYSYDTIVSDANMVWFVADMAVYNELYPENNKVLSDEVKQACVDKIIADAVSTTSTKALAKSIIALRSMGYNPREVYGVDLKKTDIVARLTALVDEKSSAVTEVYTLPWVIIALGQGEDYATDMQMSYLLGEAIANKEEWQHNEWGTDAAAFMLLALAPYYDIDENVGKAVDEAISLITAAQDESGIIGNACSTGLVMVALSAYGMDASDVVNNGNSLIDGLMSQSTDALDGFEPTSNTFSTEQGFRGLLAWQMMKNKNGLMYDFSTYPAEDACATWQPSGCPVVFDVSPDNAQVTLSGAEALKNGKYDLFEGTYNYSVTADGYETESGTITVSAEDVANHTLKEISVSLETYTSGGGGGGGGFVPKKDKEEPKKEDIKEEVKEETVTPQKVFDENTFSDIKASDWHYESVKYVYQNNLMQGTEKGFEPERKMTRAMLVTVLYRMENTKNDTKQLSFVDVNSDDWYAEAVAWANESGIVTGLSEGVFAPEDNVTREQMAVIIYRYAQFKGYDVKTEAELTKYSDANGISNWAADALRWANGTQLINGVSNDTIAPKDTATRAQVATILMRFCESLVK